MAGRVFAGMPRVFTKALKNSDQIDYTPVDGVPVEDVAGVFTSAYQAVLAAGIDVESARPMVSLAATDCPTAQQGDQFTIGGVEYQAVEVQPDSFGMVVFILHEASEA